jgi:hypothetical protein
MLDAMGDMVAQDFLLDSAQRRLRRGDLGHHIDAIAIVLHHSGEAADLAFNSFQSPQT